MIYSVKGELIHTEPGLAVIQCGGVGFKCFISMNTQRTLPRIGEEAMLYTYLSVREDALDLFGFATSGELNCYKMLTGISGVGPKVGLAILSELTPESVAMAAASGDTKAFARASGVGPKLAQRIVLELRDKVKGMFGGGERAEAAAVAAPSSHAAQAVQALGALGYSPSEAAAAVGRIDPSLKTEEIIRLALKALSKF
jgi:Holliday junction DNA helicase RuvA